MKKNYFLTVLLGASFLAMAGCSALWPQMSEQLTNPYGGYAGTASPPATPLTRAQRNRWLASTMPPPPVSAMQATMIEDAAFQSDFLTAVWLRFSNSPAAQQYKKFCASWQTSMGEGVEYASGSGGEQLTQTPPKFVDESYSELRLLARRGDAWGQYSLGDFYVRLATRQWPYLGMEPTLAADPHCLAELHGIFCRRAYFWMRRAAEQNVAQAQDAFGWMEQTGFGGPVNFGDAVRWYTLSAEEGNVSAQYQLAEIYSGGPDKNLALAVHYYRLVAHQGQPNAEFALAMAYRRGAGVRKDAARYKYWLGKADVAQYAPAVAWESKLLLGPLAARARAGDARAQYALAWACYEGKYLGRYVTQSNRNAVYWFGRGAAQGYALSERAYAGFLASGVGVAVNKPAAYYWARRAARQHLAGGECLLGQLYLKGIGVARNYAKAMHWLKLAVAQGNAGGETELGWMYATGTGVACNDREAAYLYGLAARQGNTTAASDLRSLEQTAAGGSGTFNPVVGAGMVHQQQDTEAQAQQNQAAEDQAQQRVQEANGP